MATVYAMAACIVIQVAVPVFPHLGLPKWLITAVISLALVGFSIALIISWVSEWGPEGMVRTQEIDDTEAPARPATKRSWGGTEVAHEIFTWTVTLLEEKLQEYPEEALYHSALGITLAGAGPKDRALRLALIATELFPIRKMSAMASCRCTISWSPTSWSVTWTRP